MSSAFAGLTESHKRDSISGIPSRTSESKISKSQPRKRLTQYLSTRYRKPQHHYWDVYNLARNHPPFLYGMNLMKKLPVHDGCVNTICWNSTGDYILSGSDDCNLCITKPTCMFDTSKDYTVLHKIPTRHLGNIFGAQFMPNSCDNILVSCSSEGPIIVHDINSTNPFQGIYNFNCHSSTIHEVVTIPDDDKVFLSCGEDKTVRIFDLRCHKSCARAGTCPHPALIRNSYAIASLSLHPLNSNILLVGRADGCGLVYDRRKLPDVCKFSREKAHLDYLARQQTVTNSSGSSDNSDGTRQSSFKYLHPLDGVVSQFIVPELGKQSRITSLCYSPKGEQVLVSYSQDYIYLFNVDKSSNFELVQTLPRKDPSSASDTSNTAERPGNQIGRGCARVPQGPRIRVRGDWSDTGIHSVPLSSRLDNDTDPNTDIFQRITSVASRLGLRRSGGPRFFPFGELIAGPIEHASSTGETSDDHDYEVSSRDEILERDDDTSDSDMNIGDKDDIDYQSSAQSSSHISEMKSESDDQTGDFLPSSKKSEISQAKMKFQKTVQDLKDKYSNITTYLPRFCYQGHRNSKTFIKEVKFWGDDYIMSGSDCGRIMIWEKETAKLVMGFPADERVVNCLAPNPHHYALASSGIDHDIKLWSTQSIRDCPLRISQDEIDKIVKNNELMLEEARETITVPPHLFFRVLVSFPQNLSISRH